MPGFEVRPFGPFLKGAVDAANSRVDLSGALVFARNAFMNGIGRLCARPGTTVALTLKDDDATPDDITSVICLVPFSDQALAVGHSTATEKFYLYRLTSDLTGWYDDVGVLHDGDDEPEPVAVLWETAPDAADVFIAEGLGQAYIAHSNAGDTYQSRVYSVADGLDDLEADLQGVGVETTYFRGFAAFQQHLWGWGYGSEASGDNVRPELLRFGQPNFATDAGGYFLQGDSFTVGHHVQSAREKVIGVGVAGQVMYVGTPTSLWPVTGFGRNSWDKSRPLDDSYGFGGPKCMATAGQVLYYWSSRGPMRVSGLGRPEPLWDALAAATASVVDPARIITTFDADRDQVMYLYQNGTSGRVSVIAAFDVRRDCWLGPDGDIGLGVFCAGYVAPILVDGPDGPPTGASTTDVGSSVATAHLTPGDTSPGTKTIWEYKLTADSVWTVAGETVSTETSFQFTGLTFNSNYHWRAKHQKNGQDSAYLGPSVDTAFTTTDTLISPANCFMTGQPSPCKIFIHWTNSGESGVSTEVYFGSENPPTSLAGTATPGVSSMSRSLGGESGTYYARVRHVKTGRTPSNYSNTATRTQSCSGGGPF